jgi:hypothetical protein
VIWTLAAGLLALISWLANRQQDPDGAISYTKVAVVIGSVGLFAAIASRRRAQGRKKLELLECGKMCVHCGSTDVVPGKAGVTCGACGQTTFWTLIKHAPLSDADITKVSQPDFRKPLDL